jgi:polar amino acid transport system substrate-binding protein
MKKSLLGYLVAALAALSLFLVGACSAHTSATAQAGGLMKAGVLKIGTSNNIKPYAYEENGKLTGFEIDLITAAAQKLHLTPQFVAMDFSGLLPALNNHQFDVVASAVGITPDRAKMVDFSNGYLAGYFGVLTTPNSGITSKVSSVAGKHIAVLQGSIEDTNSSTFIPGAQVVRFPDDNSAFLALSQHRIDGFFNDYDPDLTYTKKNPSLHLTQPIVMPATAFPAGWAVHKGNTVLLSRLNTALNEIVKDGTWLKLYKNYFPQDPVPTANQLPPYKAAQS